MVATKTFIENHLSYLPQQGVISNASKSIVLLRSFFPATEGSVKQSSTLKLGLCMSLGGEIHHRYANRSLSEYWRRGDVYILGPASCGQFSSPDVDMIGLAIDMKHADFSDESLQPLQNLRHCITSDKLIRSILIALWNAATRYDSELFIEHGVKLILRTLLDSNPQRITSKSKLARPLSPYQLQKVVDYIQKNISERIRVSELSNLTDMKPKSFADSLKSASGFAPYAFITHHRMIIAKRYLTEGLSVTDTAFSVGYSNPGKFSAAFYRQVGSTPGKWRNSQFSVKL